MIRLGSLCIILVIWAMLVALVLGDITGPIKQVLPGGGGALKTEDISAESVVEDRSAKIHPVEIENSNPNFKPGDVSDEGLPQIDVQRGNDDNSYFVSFEEVGEPLSNSSNALREGENRMLKTALMKPYHEKFLAEMKTLRDLFYSSRSRQQDRNFAKRFSDEETEHSFNQGVNQYVLQAEKIVNDIYHMANSIRKQLGVGRKEAPSKFVNAGETNGTLTAIDEILNDLKYQLRKTIGCKGCYNPHPELSEFLEWLVLGNSCKLCTPTSKRKENPGFFHRRLKKPIPCAKKLAAHSIKKPADKINEAAKLLLDEYINNQQFRKYN